MSRVTVLVPTYNRADLLPACLESIRAQTFTDWHTIVGDNGSTDGSAQLVLSLGDPRFELVRRPDNVGYVRNTNMLLDLADSDFIAILHSDDWWEPDFLARLVELLDQAPQAIIAASAARLVLESGESRVERLVTTASPSHSTVLSSPEAARMLVRRAFLQPSGVLARRDLYRDNRFEESLPYTNDRAMWFRAASLGGIATTAEPLSNYRIHTASVFGQSADKLLWADEGMRLAARLEEEWRLNGPPYRGAEKELRMGDALRWIMKSYELHERGNRQGALKLTRLARETAPSRIWSVAATLEGIFVRCTTPGVAAGARRLVAKAARRVPRPRQAGGPRATGVPTDKLRWSAGDVLRALRESH
jgi:glycosyltransferase involved in cell wall biosynthesis